MTASASHCRDERLYARFLALYPRPFREAYGASLRQLFHDLLDDPTVPRGRLWLSVLADIPGSVLPEHRARLQHTGGTAMTHVMRWVGHPGARRGIVAGLVLGLAWTIYNLINNALNLDARGYALINNSATAVLVLVFMYAGFVGARHVGTIRGGTCTAIIAAVVGSGIGIVTLWLATWFFFAQIGQNAGMIADFHRSGARSMNALIIEDAFGATFFGACFSVILGALLGTIGGAAAKAINGLRVR